MPENFSFLIEGKLAASGLPGWAQHLDDDLDDLRAEGITAIVSLTEEPLPASPVQRRGFTYRHLPVVDFTPPTLDQFREFANFVDNHDGAVLVHCRAGIGRTGTMLAAYLIAQGLSAKEALRTVRQQRPGSVETREQEARLVEWEKALRK
jgi:atypical dual specificity phosphatase